MQPLTEYWLRETQNFFRNRPKLTLLMEFANKYPSLDFDPKKVALAFSKINPEYKLADYVIVGIELPSKDKMEAISCPSAGVFDIFDLWAKVRSYIRNATPSRSRVWKIVEKYPAEATTPENIARLICRENTHFILREKPGSNQEKRQKKRESRKRKAAYSSGTSDKHVRVTAGSKRKRKRILTKTVNAGLDPETCPHGVQKGKICAICNPEKFNFWNNMD